GVTLPARLVRCVALLPAALLAALVVVGTFGGDRALVLDARAAGVAVAALAAWRKAPFPVVIVLAAAGTGTIPAPGWPAPMLHLAVHGHFYQPPRETPWTETVPVEPSAAPYHDWNERITAEAYRPNARARIVDDRGRIVAIVNDYAL